MNRQFTPAGIALAVFIATAPAFATQTADASLSGFGITLYDLNPDDGIAPSITFSQSPGLTWDAVYSAGDTSAGGHYVDDTRYGYTVAAPLSAHIEVPGGTATASVSGDLQSGGATLRASSATTSSPPGTISAWAYLVGDMEREHFTLSPATLLVMSGTVALSATSTDIDPSSSASLFVQLASNANPSYYQYSAWENHVFAGQSVDETFLLSLANPGSEAMTGFTSANANASIFPIPPVPEPATAGLLLAGLAVLGAVRRRADRAARP
jgi:hypothetical protein